jgi:hypothetical protein
MFLPFMWKVNSSLLYLYMYCTYGRLYSFILPLNFSVLYLFCKIIKESSKILAFVVVLLEIINF